MAAPAPKACDFGAPKAGEGTDQGKLKKLAQRVEQILTEMVLFHDPKQVPPHKILVAPLNRQGAPPNLQYIHFGILKGMQEKGFDRTRPQVGILVEFRSPAAKKALLDHNKRFSGSSMMPPIHEDEVLYGSLAGSHLNLALRLIRARSQSPIGDLSKLLEDDEGLKDAVESGHRWWILPEHVSPGGQVDISLWRNQDQNENQGLHEMEILQTLVTTAEDLSKTTSKVNLSDLVAKAMRKNPARIAAATLSTFAKFYVGFLGSGDQHLIQELVDFHSSKVNPRDLVVSTNFYSTLAGEKSLQKFPFLRLYLVLSQYTMEKSRSQAGGPTKNLVLFY